MSEWSGLLGAVLGAAVGFLAVWWQHQAQKKQNVRTRGAEMIFIGDQFLDSYYRVSLISDDDVRDAPDLQNQRLDQMTAILRYLELVAHKKLHKLAHAYMKATSNINWVADASSGQEKLEARYGEARAAFMVGLKK